MIYLELFISFLTVGFLGIGGGMAAMPLIQYQVVDVHGWMTLEELANVIAVTELTPGPFAINAATFVGAHVGGGWGRFIATTAYILPSMIILIILSQIYKKLKNAPSFQGITKGLNYAIAGLVSYSAFTFISLSLFSGTTLATFSVQLFPLVIFVASFFLLKKFEVNSIFIILGAGLLGGVYYQFF